MSKYYFDWSFGNSKLAKEGTVAFNIPALRAGDGYPTCPNAGICAAICYAQQGRYVQTAVKSVRERNILKLRSMTDPYNHDNSGWGWIDVEAELRIDLDNMPPRIKQVRIHDSGDFYDHQYFYTWCRVASDTPSKVFYAYTKQITAYQRLLEEGKVPRNLFIVQSVGGKEDSFIDPLLPHSRIFPSLDALESSRYVNCTHTDVPVYQGARCIGLVYHGTRKLTTAQASSLTNIAI